MTADIWQRAAVLPARAANVRRMIWRTLVLIALMLGAMAAAKARAADCPGNPNALGTSRVMTIDPREFPRIGTVQYSHSLPLEDKEVVLTFDDGPLPPYTNRVLDVLAEHCVKANYFLVGRMARGYPDLARRILAEGHTIGTHSENHLLGFDKRAARHGEERDRAGHRFGRSGAGQGHRRQRRSSASRASCAARRSKPICSRAA